MTNVRILLLALSLALPGATFAQEPEDESEAGPGESSESAKRQRRGFSTRETKSGVDRSKPAFGGPTSPEGEIVETDLLKQPAFRFPAADEAFKPWNAWKARQSKDHGFDLSAHYSTMYQGLSDSLTGRDAASAGVLRFTGKWTLVGRGTKNTGSLVVTLDHRHAFRGDGPANLAGDTGYIGVTGLFYNDMGAAVINLNWQQGFNDGNTGLIVGRYDPNDYMNVLGYVNPWSIFSNLASNLDASVALPDSSWGIGAGHWVSDSMYVIGGINDANGFGGDDLEFFDGGAEFFKYAHIGWSPTRADRYFRNIHIMAWHVDSRDDLGIPSAKGITMAANWTFDDRWMPFARLGFSDGAAPIYNESATLGMIYKFLYRSDLVGVAANWGSPPDSSLRDQTTIEAFRRFQFSQNFAITPSLQLLMDPALNPVDDEIWVYGVRMRLTF